MNLFVKEARKLINLKEPITVVIGNESCDLDSAVCAVSLAYYYSKSSKTPEHTLANGKPNFLPVMNILRKNLPIKTEVTYFLQKNGIDVNDLVCCNELPADLINVSKFVLVDHHVASVSTPADKVIQIFDHRPLDINAKIPAECKVNINEVGSCATLIADEILTKEQSMDDFVDILSFLRGPIVLDTINFSPEADKSRPLDVDVNKKIEHLLQSDGHDKNTLFNDLVKARSDVGGLTSMQLLSKDLKIITNKSKSMVIPVAGFPLLVEEYIKKNNAFESLQQFGREKSSGDILVVMGLKELPGGGVRRDLGLIVLRNTNLAKDVCKALSNDNGPYLQLKEKLMYSSDSLEVRLFEQLNVKASRKQILPIVQQILDQY